MTLPIIGITMGDPAGVGPEVVMKALARADAYALCRPLVIGDAKQLARANVLLNLNLNVVSVLNPEKAKFTRGTVEVIEVGQVPENLPYGKVSAVAGEAAYRYIERAVKLALERSIDAICTAPINKEALNAAGHKFPGHTELLAKLTGTNEVSLTLLAPKLRVIHVTAHIGLLDAIEKIDAGLVERTIARGRELLGRAGTPQPRSGVCGINPPAGEGGLFGRGEEKEDRPAVAAAAAPGWSVDGPLPADSLFYLRRAATTTWWWRCTTTRGTARSRRWAWSMAST
jgi:4-hydroxythreonine-4-phosphate dehydrogenase